MPAVSPDTGKDETLLAVENLLKEMGEDTETEYNPGASTSSGPTYVPTPIKILQRTAACAVMPCHVPTRPKLVTPAPKPPEAELPSKPGRGDKTARKPLPRPPPCDQGPGQGEEGNKGYRSVSHEASTGQENAGGETAA